MSQINVDTIRSRTGAAPQLDKGAEVTVGYGITGAGGINVSGVITCGGVTATGLSGTPDITVNNVTAGFGTFTEFVAFSTSISIGGTLTYEDTTNVDAVGLITARSGIEFGASGVGGTITGTGQAEFAGVVTATSFSGSGANLTGVISGIEIEQAGSSVGTALTIVNFNSGATITASGAGATVTIAAGIETNAGFSTNTVRTLSIGSYQDHKETVTGFVTFTSTGGSEGESHTLRIINSGIATVGFSTYFLWPSGSSPSVPTTDGTISLISFTVQRVGTAGTQLLAGASLDFS
tara:strand:+ start:238 stop:1116 length:879 start_codon:yes stop_codon:yes gene_type:complete